MKTAFLFSGQGSQYVGMGKELFGKYGACKQIAECGSDIMGFDIMQRLTESAPEELAQTRLSQPAIFTVSLLALTAAREEGIENSAVAGHSLGEYAAMFCAGMLDLENSYKAIKLRSEAMAKASENTKGAMAAVMSGDAEFIEKVCNEVEGYCAPANYNSASQTVIAGEEAAVDAAMARFAEQGVRCVKLAVSAAFHTKFMQPAAEEFKEAVKDFPFAAPQCDYYANLTGKKLEFGDMPDYLSKHICSPVRFTDELAAMKADGIDTFVELGPGKVLTGLVRKTLTDVRFMNIEDCKTMEKALAALKDS